MQHDVFPNSPSNQLRSAIKVKHEMIDMCQFKPSCISITVPVISVHYRITKLILKNIFTPPRLIEVPPSENYILINLYHTDLFLRTDKLVQNKFRRYIVTFMYVIWIKDAGNAFQKQQHSYFNCQRCRHKRYLAAPIRMYNLNRMHILNRHRFTCNLKLYFISVICKSNG